MKIRAGRVRSQLSIGDEGAMGHPVLCSVCPVLCPVVPSFDDFSLIDFLFLQMFTRRHNTRFLVLIPVVVGSNPIRHPILF